jgi:CobQ/CobB/MinD/ParA nucleotide binding domain
MPCKVIFTAGAKGGSGKTTAACFVVAYVQQHGVTPLIMDLDDESKSLSRFYPEALQVNIHQEFAHDVLIEKATSDRHAFILADLKGGTGHGMLHWFLDVPFNDLRQEGVEFVCIGSVTTAPDSVQSFESKTSMEVLLPQPTLKNPQRPMKGEISNAPWQSAELLMC